VSVTSNELSAVSAQAVSAINVVSNALSDLISIHNVLSNRVSANSGVGGGGSVTSAELSAVSAQAASAIADLASQGVSSGNAVSNKFVSIISTLGTLSTVSATAAQANSVLSQACSVAQAALSNRISVTSAAWSNKCSAVSAAVTSVKNEASNKSSVISQALSVTNAAVSNLTSAHNALSNAVSALSAGQLSQLSQAVSVLSQAISTLKTATYTWVIASPATGQVLGPRIKQQHTAKYIVGGTISSGTAVVFNIEKRGTLSTAGTNLLPSDATISATEVSTGVSADTGIITADGWLVVDISGTSGTPTQAVITLGYTIP
jgi:hypothetical protein